MFGVNQIYGHIENSKEYVCIVHEYPKDAVKIEILEDLSKVQYLGNWVTVNCSHTHLNKPIGIECSEFLLLQSFANGRTLVMPPWLLKLAQWFPHVCSPDLV